MDGNHKWWNAWAPYWEYLEDRHMSTRIADKLAEGIRGPVLVLGAGQGLIVERLREKGLSVDGVDLDDRMIALAKTRRSLEIQRCDAAALPFENESYRTVIVSTGVIDYLTDNEKIARIIAQARRVTRSRGDVIFAFYQADPALKEIYRRIGILSCDGRWYHMSRMFEIFRTLKIHPLRCVPLVARWTGSSIFSAFFYWSWLGLTLPAKMKEEQQTIERIFELAEKDGVEADVLYDSVPERLPYRDQAAVRDLLKENGIANPQIDEVDDCIIARHRVFELNREPPHEHTRPPAILTTGLCKRYGNTVAVDAVDLVVEQRTIHGILGPNGAGKTTIISMLVGLVQPDAGSLTFPGLSSNEDPAHAIGYVPQELALYTRLSARRNLAFFGKLYGIRKPELDERIEHLLQVVGLGERGNEPVSNFSTGMMRRLNLAAGLLHKPTIIFLDEPTVGIDPQSRNCIFEAISEIRDTGATVIYTTHYMEEAMLLCDRISIMDHGRIVLEDTPARAVASYGLTRMDFVTDGTTGLELEKEMMAIGPVKDVVANDGTISVFGSRIENTVELLNAIKTTAMRRGVKISLQSVREPSLESVFLDITGKNLRDALLKERTR